jgi:GNAT superfamily N-acetyltransferase
MKLVRTDTNNEDFIELVKALDEDLRVVDGDDHVFYAALNKVTDVKHVIVAYENNIAVGCGALRAFDNDTMEVKRMYVKPEYRGKGVAAQIVHALELWAAEIGYKKTVLETGKRQPAAIALYLKTGYNIVPNFGKYIGVENSVCFEKILKG